MPIPRKGGVTPDTVNRDSDNLGAVFAKLGENLVVERYLVAAHRTPVSRIEHEYDRSPAKLAQAEHLIRCRVEREVGRARAGAENFRDVYGRCGLCHSFLLRSYSAVGA